MKMSKKIDYDEYRKQLIEVSTQPVSQLNVSLPGRLKYDPVTLKPQPFEGISLIHNINSVQAQQLHLSQMAQDFKHQLQSSKLINNVAFVNLNSFHATTFDLINQVEHSNALATKGYQYIAVRGAVEKETIKFVKDIGPRLSAKVTIESIGMFAPAVVKLNLTFHKIVEKVFQAYRSELNKHLIDNVDGYLAVRKASWDQRLSAHITFGYVVNPMSTAEVDEFLKVMKKFNGALQPIQFELTQGEVTGFTDMDNYYVI